ncbi:hypothetical protein [Herbiconiux daphne]|uniref:DUF2975 domain-containing protein n=1 Tax=Herbiconiux daphne TaxID=2970914 RepID=A0ABT2H1M3_9MICO|nr:hypothetical protein [Herbiconiux daphne]MCS5733822.1 hypothetical protein [Herbiconiux daphne]
MRADDAATSKPRGSNAAVPLGAESGLVPAISPTGADAFSVRLTDSDVSLRTGASEGTTGVQSSADIPAPTDAAAPARRGRRWFAIESGAAAGVAAFFASQAFILVSSSGTSPSANAPIGTSPIGSAIAAGLVIALLEAVLVTGFGLLAWVEVESRRFTARGRGYAVMLRVTIGTFVFGIAASGLLGSWQAWLLSTSITLIAAVVGGYVAARCVWRDEADRTPRREQHADEF